MAGTNDGFRLFVLHFGTLGFLMAKIHIQRSGDVGRWP